MYKEQGNFLARLARAVVRARREPGPVLLFCDNKRMAEQICERARAELMCPAGSVLLLSSPTGLEIIARSDDGVVEGVIDPTRRFYVGVQWHPERTEAEETGLGVVRSLVQAAS